MCVFVGYLGWYIYQKIGYILFLPSALYDIKHDLSVLFLLGQGILTLSINLCHGWCIVGYNMLYHVILLNVFSLGNTSLVLITVILLLLLFYLDSIEYLMSTMFSISHVYMLYS